VSVPRDLLLGGFVGSVTGALLFFWASLDDHATPMTAKNMTSEAIDLRLRFVTRR
jgi:hypothetical protein